MARSAAGGTESANHDETAPAAGWQRRPVLASTARAVISLTPILISTATALLLNRALPRPHSVLALVARIGFILVASFVALAVVDRQMRKLLPLAALLQLSLLFPDQMPNRFKLALKAGSSRRMALAVENAQTHGISDERALAAEQLVLLATAIGDHDRRTRGHSERVRLFADLIALELKLPAEERAKLQWAALIHDIGKITVPADILNKKGAPTKREWEILQRHPGKGEALAAPVAPWLGEWVHAVGGHHEKWDGSGYPRGLAGAAIPRAAAIVAVADSFEVMTAVRSYKKAMPLPAARAELTRCAGTHFDPDIVRALLSVSIGRLRGAMGIFAGLAHVPFIGPLTTAAAHAPDTVTAAVGATASGATAGLSMAAIGGAMVLGPTSPTGTITTAPAAVSVVRAEAVPEVVAAEVVAVVPATETTSAPAAPVSRFAAANVEPASSVPAQADPAAVRVAQVASQTPAVQSDSGQVQENNGRGDTANSDTANSDTANSDTANSDTANSDTANSDKASGKSRTQPAYRQDASAAKVRLDEGDHRNSNGSGGEQTSRKKSSHSSGAEYD